MPPWVDLMRPTPTSFRCCICFDAVEVDDAYADPSGQAWDMCQPCGEGEERATIFCFMAGRYGRVMWREVTPGGDDRKVKRVTSLQQHLRLFLRSALWTGAVVVVLIVCAWIGGVR